MDKPKDLDEGMKTYDSEVPQHVREQPCTNEADYTHLDPEPETPKNVKGSSCFDRQRNKNQMSVSRSGRYKQRQRRRSGILDNPDLTQQQQEDVVNRVRALSSPVPMASVKPKEVPSTKRMFSCEPIDTSERSDHLQVEAL